MEGWSEGFDAELLQPWSDTIRDALNEVLPEGLRILGGAPLETVPGLRRPSLMAACRRARYLVDLRHLEPDRLASCRGRVEEFPRAASWVVERRYWIPSGSPEPADWEGGTRGDASGGRPEQGEKARQVELKEAILGMRFLDEDGGSGGAPQDPSGTGRLEMELRLEHPQGHTANPRVVLERLLGLTPEEQAAARVARCALLDQSGNPVLPS
jgi:hypothetical protein